jgi:hypothetical protein
MQCAHTVGGVLTVLRMVPIVETVDISDVRRYVTDGRLQRTDSMSSGAMSMLDELARVSVALAPLRLTASASA